MDFIVCHEHACIRSRLGKICDYLRESLAGRGCIGLRVRTTSSKSKLVLLDVTLLLSCFGNWTIDEIGKCYRQMGTLGS